MIDAVAPLRKSLRIEENPGNPDFPAVLVDAELGRRLRLDPRGLEIARALDQTQTVEELTERVGGETSGITRVIDFFSGLNLLDTDEARLFVAGTQNTQQQMADPDTVPLLIRDDATFSCTMCGSCCGGHNVGPVDPQTLTGLQPIREELIAKTHAAKGLFLTVQMEHEGKVEDQFVCQSRNGSCIFLSDDRRCIIHSDYGGDRKPSICRLFPYQFIATPNGIAVSLQMECRGFTEARVGTPLKDQEEELRGLLKLVPQLRSVRPVILLDDKQPLPYPEYERLEDAIHQAIDAQPDNPAAALLKIRALVESERGRNPDIEPEPEAIAAYTAELRELMQTLGDTARALEEEYGRADETVVVHTGSLPVFAQATDLFLAEIRRIGRPLESADQRSLFRETMHHQLMSKELTTARTLRLGLAQMNFRWLMAKAIMIDRARAVKRRHLVAQDVTDAVVTMSFLGRHQTFREILQAQAQTLEKLFYDDLPILLQNFDGMIPANPPVEFHKF